MTSRLSPTRTDIVGFSLLSLETRFSEVVAATRRVMSGVRTKSTICVLLNSHCRKIAPAGLCRVSTGNAE